MDIKKKAEIATHVYISEDILWEDSPVTPGMYEIFEVLDEGISLFDEHLKILLWEELEEATFLKKEPCGGAGFCYNEIN